MPNFVGLDVSKRTTSICVIDRSGSVVLTGVVASDPKAVIGFLRGEGRRYRLVGLEAGSLAPWIYAGLAKAGFPVVCIETWHAHSLLKSKRPNKTDRNDALGIAEIMRGGLYKTVHIKSVENQQIRATLAMRRALKTKAIDIDNFISTTLLTFGIKLRRGGAITTFARRARQAAGADTFLLELMEPLLQVRDRLVEEAVSIQRRIISVANEDPVCRRLMTAPAIGPITALTFRSAVDEPRRFVRSRNLGAHFGLTPVVRQSGDTLVRGHISRRGDASVRQSLFLAAFAQLRSGTKESWLKKWTAQVASRRGKLKAVVAAARRLAVILHKMWVSETDFQWALAI